MAPLPTIIDAAREALAGPCEAPAGTGIVAACSGGADSVALVHALAALTARWPLAAVVFVDHGLRDVEVERAAAARAAEEVGAVFVTRRVTLGAGNKQATARAARYEALLDAAGPETLVATGHTRSDQAETVLQRVIRGAGLRGLAGIAWREGRLVRPLLGVSRSGTRALGLHFIDDPTNATGSYQRNRIRAHVLPALAAENPAVERALADLAEDARTELSTIDALASLLPLDELDGRGVPAPVLAAIARWRHAREIGGWSPARGAVLALAAQLSAGLPGSTSLGRGVDGSARAGRLRFEATRDPRWEVVAHGPGTYRLPTATVVIREVGGRASGNEPETAGTRGGAVIGDVPAASLAWPLTVRRSSQAAPRGPVAGERGAEDATEPRGRFAGRAGNRGEAGRFVITDALGTELPATLDGGGEYSRRAAAPDADGGDGRRIRVEVHRR